MSKSVGYGVLGLSLVLLGVLVAVPFLKNRFPRSFPEGFEATDLSTRKVAKKPNH